MRGGLPVPTVVAGAAGESARILDRMGGRGRPDGGRLLPFPDGVLHFGSDLPAPVLAAARLFLCRSGGRLAVRRSVRGGQGKGSAAQSLITRRDRAHREPRSSRGGLFFFPSLPGGPGRPPP